MACRNERSLRHAKGFPACCAVTWPLVFMLAAALAGRFAPSFNIPLRSLSAAVMGGLSLGYGAA